MSRRPFVRSQVHELLVSLFNSDAFRATFQLGDGRGHYAAFWGPARITHVGQDRLARHSSSFQSYSCMAHLSARPGPGWAATWPIRRWDFWLPATMGSAA